MSFIMTIHHSQASIRLETGNTQPANYTWLRAIESDLRPLNIGPSYASCAWKKTTSQEHRRSIVDLAVLKKKRER